VTNSVSALVLRTPEAPGPWIAGIGALAVEADARGGPGLLTFGPRVRASYHTGQRHVSCTEVRPAPGTGRPPPGAPAVDFAGRTPMGVPPRSCFSGRLPAPHSCQVTDRQ
jgi:hypothetical protein